MNKSKANLELKQIETTVEAKMTFRACFEGETMLVRGSDFAEVLKEIKEAFEDDL